MPASAGGDSTSFRVQDYIPERFTDFSWKLDGGAGLRRYGSDYTTYNNDYYVNHGVVYPPNLTESERSYLDLKLSNSWTYTFITRQATFACDWALEAGIGGHSSTREEASGNGSTYIFEEAEERPSRNYDIGLSLKGELRRYLLSGFHIAALGDFQYSYKTEHNASEEDT